MNILDRAATGAYKRALGCYPRRFRKDFADEMLDTFTSRLQDAGSTTGRIRVIVLELTALPLSLVREHRRERRHTMLEQRGGLTMAATATAHPFRSMMRFWMFIVALYAAVVVAPFFLFGIHTYSVQDIASGRLDPKSTCVPAEGRLPHPKCVSLYGDSPMLAVTYAVMLLAPALGIVFTVVSVWRLARRWTRLRAGQRAAGAAVAAAGLSLAAFAMSPLGSLISVWLMD